jgi:hypothetical protein
MRATIACRSVRRAKARGGEKVAQNVAFAGWAILALLLALFRDSSGSAEAKREVSRHAVILCSNVPSDTIHHSSHRFTLAPAAGIASVYIFLQPLLLGRLPVL